MAGISSYTIAGRQIGGHYVCAPLTVILGTTLIAIRD